MEKKRNENIWVHVWVVFCLMCWIGLAALLGGCQYVSESQDGPVPAQITFLDVGQGLAVLLERNGRYAMYDMGPDSVGVVDSLVARGIDTLDWVLVSHGHRDHGGGFMELQDVFGGMPKVYVKKLYVGPDTSKSFVTDSILWMARRLHILVDTVYRGDDFVWEGMRMKVLWPPEFRRVGENGASVVLQVDMVDSGLDEESLGRVLLTGDLDSSGESRLRELSLDLKASLLQVPHHGSAGSSSLKFLSEVMPGFAVVSVGAGNSYGHPTEAVLQKLKYVVKDSASIYRTDFDGSVRFFLMPGIGVVR